MKFILPSGEIPSNNTSREREAVADKFDPYREALVMEINTIWPAELGDMAAGDRNAIERKLHDDPAACSQLEYVRTHTGFCRQITVSQADIDRVRG